jgi:hypothetical protein
MGGRRQKSLVGIVMVLIYNIDTLKEEKNITSTLFKIVLNNESKLCHF